MTQYIRPKMTYIHTLPWMPMRRATDNCLRYARTRARASARNEKNMMLTPKCHVFSNLFPFCIRLFVNTYTHKVAFFSFLIVPLNVCRLSAWFHNGRRRRWRRAFCYISTPLGCVASTSANALFDGDSSQRADSTNVPSRERSPMCWDHQFIIIMTIIFFRYDLCSIQWYASPISVYKNA